MKRFSQRFWLWVDKRIVLSRVQAGFDEVKHEVVNSLSADTTDKIDGFFHGDFNGLAGIVDDSTDVAEYDTITKGTYPLTEAIKKGYDKS